MVSEAGREFCYVDVIHPEGTFDECDLPDYKEMFACCDRVANGDLNIAYDCKTTLPGGGSCATPDDCIENYRTGL